VKIEVKSEPQVHSTAKSEPKIEVRAQEPVKSEPEGDSNGER